MTDYMKMISVFANSNADYYCFSDEDSNGNINNYIVLVQEGIMVTYEFITRIDLPSDKAQAYVGMTTEHVDFKSLGEYVAYRYDVEIEPKVVENSDFCDI